jgi:mannose-1-phosphate guanylyltransferase
VTPSDHWIDQQEEYNKAVERATEIAKQDYIAAISIRPTRPYEGYGYIRAEGEDVISFCEKPKVDQAVDFLKKSNWFWNSGIYCFKAGVLLEELRNQSLSIWEGSKSVYEKQVLRSSNQFSYPDMDCIPEESIDRAVIQKSKILKMVLLQTGWSDIGSLEDLAEYFRQSRVVPSEKPGIFQFQSSNNMVLSDSMPVALIDVEDLIIVASKNGILISKRGSSHKVKHVNNTNSLAQYLSLFTYVISCNPVQSKSVQTEIGNFNGVHFILR